MRKRNGMRCKKNGWKRRRALLLLTILVLAGCAEQECSPAETEAEIAQTETQAAAMQETNQEKELKPQEATRTVEVSYSNIADEESRKFVEEALISAGVSAERQRTFFEHVEQFNACAGEGDLTGGFETAAATEIKYDPYELQERWQGRHEDFEGYNCRITAYGLYGDALTLDSAKQMKRDSLMTENLDFDLYALGQDASAVPTETERDKFLSLYAAVPTDATKDVKVHAAHMQEAWRARGLGFSASEKLRLISVVFHDKLTEGQDKLFIGHIGILLPLEDGRLCFLEKVAFQEPYRANLFQNRAKLCDYLMEKYDLEYHQPAAAPFIMENAELLSREDV